jgi:hypothetical protein
VSVVATLPKTDQRAVKAANFSQPNVDKDRLGDVPAWSVLSRSAMPKLVLRILLYAMAAIGVGIPVSVIAFVGLALVGF